MHRVTGPSGGSDSRGETVNLIFVGFGFGQENLDLALPTDNHGPTKQIYATNTHINQRRWDNLESSVLALLSRSKNERRRAAFNGAYTAGRINTAATCSDLRDRYSLEW